MGSAIKGTSRALGEGNKEMHGREWAVTLCGKMTVVLATLLTNKDYLT